MNTSLKCYNINNEGEFILFTELKLILCSNHAPYCRLLRIHVIFTSFCCVKNFSQSSLKMKKVAVSGVSVSFVT